jgi:hypothetical protein
VNARLTGRDLDAGELRRTWKDWLLIAAATSLFVGVGTFARVPQMEIQSSWLGFFAAALLSVLAVGAVALWRITKFT